MLISSQTASVLQIFCELSLYFQVIFKNIEVAGTGISYDRGNKNEILKINILYYVKLHNTNIWKFEKI